MRLISILALLLILSNSIGTSVLADGSFHADYVPRPGTSLHESGAEVLDVALHWLVAIPSIYYRAFGKWPRSWAEIEESRIFTAQLLTTDGRQISPDDSKLDFAGDIQFMGKGEQSAPVIARLALDGRISYIRLSDFGTPVPFSRCWQDAPKGYPEHLWRATRLAEFGLDTRRHQQLAVREAYDIAADLYMKIHGSYCDWDTLQGSGLSPHRPGTLNPLTGSPWRGDGSPNDLYYGHLLPGQPATRGLVVIRSSNAAAGSFQCMITDDFGNTPWSVS